MAWFYLPVKLTFFLAKMASFCIATTDSPALTVPCAMDFHHRFVQLWDLPLNHGPKVLLQLPVVLSELLLIFSLVSSNKALVLLHCLTTPRQMERKKGYKMYHLLLLNSLTLCCNMDVPSLG